MVVNLSVLLLEWVHDNGFIIRDAKRYDELRAEKYGDLQFNRGIYIVSKERGARRASEHYEDTLHRAILRSLPDYQQENYTPTGKIEYQRKDGKISLVIYHGPPIIGWRSHNLSPGARIDECRAIFRLDYDQNVPDEHISVSVLALDDEFDSESFNPTVTFNPYASAMDVMFWGKEKGKIRDEVELERFFDRLAKVIHSDDVY